MASAHGRLSQHVLAVLDVVLRVPSIFIIDAIFNSYSEPGTGWTGTAGRALIRALDSEESSPLTSAQLRYILLHNAIPFIGFGFLDNAIMIAAGTQIELSIGLTLGISTMAAAALGNLVSDLAGLGLAGYVEALATRFGMQIPDLTPKQVDMWQTRVTSHMGKAIGITIGCILGMFPLLFLSDDDDDKEEEKKKNDPNSK
uniref:Transmembrane protein 65 n=1 Tax=Cyprinus carpio carpio TaxID=630221 RepID=A0A9J7ZRN6_CYPCA